jgi:hypothetical protein
LSKDPYNGQSHHLTHLIARATPPPMMVDGAYNLRNLTSSNNTEYSNWNQQQTYFNGNGAQQNSYNSYF